MEASDLMEIGHVTFDQALKRKMTKPRSKFTTGPFFQLVSYQFGQFKLLVRFEVDCADFAAVKAARYALEIALSCLTTFDRDMKLLVKKICLGIHVVPDKVCKVSSDTLLAIKFNSIIS